MCFSGFDCRYSGAPVDFETVEISGTMEDTDIMTDALLSVGRNGVAIKGNTKLKFIQFLVTLFTTLLL